MSSPSLSVVVSHSVKAAEARRGIVRVHPEVLTALDMREWDAVEIVGSRTTTAIAAKGDASHPPGRIAMDEVVCANAGAVTDGVVMVSKASVQAASSVTVAGSAWAASVDHSIIARALLGKVCCRGDVLTLLPREIGSAFPTSGVSQQLSRLLGVGWQTQQLTVVDSVPAGIVSIQPGTVVRFSSAGSTPSSKPAQPAATPAPQTAAATAVKASHTELAPGVAVLAASDITTEDLVGVQEQIQLASNWISVALDKADVMASLGASSHLGILVVGPSGVGKSTFARAVNSSRRIVGIQGPTVGALTAQERLAAVKTAVDAVVAAGGVLLVKDCEGLLPRNAEPVASLLCSELQKVVNATNSVLIATASSVEAVDSRLREPHMCDRVVDIGLPDGDAREKILAALLDESHHDDVDLADIASRTPGFVAADLLALCREAAMRCAVDASGEDIRVRPEDFEHALTVIRPVSRAASNEINAGSLTLDAVAGMDDTKAMLQESVLLPLQRPEAFARLGITPPRGVLLYGPPGCGKTFLIRALAGTGQLSVHSVKGSELLDKWVGSSEQAVRELFQRARGSAPSLVFLDELDALAPRRGNSMDSGVADRVVASLLTELDGAQPLENVVVVGATNRPELIDPALLRPGRLEKLVFVPPPSSEAREDILTATTADMPLDPAVDLVWVASQLDNYSSADCAAVAREAAMNSMRRDIDSGVVTAEDFQRAVETVVASLDASQVQHLREYAQQREKK